MSSPRNVSSEVPVSNNSKQKETGGSSLINESEAKDGAGDVDDNDILVASPRKGSSTVPNVK